MHFKAISAERRRKSAGQTVSSAPTLRLLLLALPSGCRATRQWQPGNLPATTESDRNETESKT